MILQSLTIALISLSVAQASAASKYTVNKESVVAGSQVTRGGKAVALYPGSLKVGGDFSKIAKAIDFKPNGKVTVISVVPSVDTPVCEQQTHILGESQELNSAVQRITVSRDLPMAQSRFAKAAKLGNIEFLSDYKSGDFGRSSGLMIKEMELLARAVIVLDQKGTIRHLQVVPELGNLPDMETAFKKANQLVGTTVN